MTFFSLPFFIFVVALTLVYFLAPKRFQWYVLLLASYLFYWYNSAWLLFVLIGTSLFTFLIGLWIQKTSDAGKDWLKVHSTKLSQEEKKSVKETTKKKAKRILQFGILIDLGALLFLKYFNFFGDNINSLLSFAGTQTAIPYLNLLLPLGISFYTLQAIAYMTDVYRGTVQADRNPAKFMLFMSFFPQIVQGPIARYDQLAHQLYEGHQFDYERGCFGCQLILWGLIKKLVIAEHLAIPVNQLFGHYTQYTGGILFLGALLYGLQVYTDFSGGMDIARGVAEILGIKLELNFNQPYYSTSIEDFWRRWHMTMGHWMRDYIFYPLTLSKSFTNLGRKSRNLLGQFAGKRLPAFVAMFIVYFAVGFWHGADWKYIVYGLWNGIFIMSGILLENVYHRARRLCGIEETAVTWKLFRILRTLVLVSFGRFFSRAKDLSAALKMFSRTLKDWQDITFLTNGSLIKLGLDTANWILLCLTILLLFYVDSAHEKGISLRQAFARQPLVFRWTIYIGAVLFILIFGCYGPEYNAANFIYEQF